MIPTDSLLLAIGVDNFLRILKMISDDDNIKMAIRNPHLNLELAAAGRGDADTGTFLRINFSSQQRPRGDEPQQHAVAAFKDVFAQTAPEPLSLLFEPASVDNGQRYTARMRTVVVSGVLPSIVKASARLKFLSKEMTVQIGRGGKLRLVLQESLVKYTAAWAGLKEIVRTMSSDDDEQVSRAARGSGQREWVSVTIPSKDWWNILQKPSIVQTIVLCITHQRSLEMYQIAGKSLELNDGYIHYYLNHVIQD